MVTWGGGYQANYLGSVIFPIFHNNQKNGHQYDIMFIFDRCHNSQAAETPDKYKQDWPGGHWQSIWLHITFLHIIWGLKFKPYNI